MRERVGTRRRAGKRPSAARLFPRSETRETFRDLFSRWGVETSFVDMTNAEEVGGAVRPSTRLFWVETPSNPHLKITDVREISGIARGAVKGIGKIERSSFYLEWMRSPGLRRRVTAGLYSG